MKKQNRTTRKKLVRDMRLPQDAPRKAIQKVVDYLWHGWVCKSCLRGPRVSGCASCEALDAINRLLAVMEEHRS